MKTQHRLRWTLPVIVAASLLGTPTVRAAGATLSLVQDGKPVYAVVVPDGNDAVAMSAATMLADTVEKASGAVHHRGGNAGPRFLSAKRARQSRPG
jgi:hypothetical protein